MNHTKLCLSLHALLVLAALQNFPCVGAAPAKDSPPQLRVGTDHWSMTLLVSEDGRLYQSGCGAATREIPKPKRGPARETEFYPPTETASSSNRPCR